MPNVAIYARQSLAVQEGIDRQLDRCRTEIARRSDWTIVHEYKDNDTSATKVRGPKTQWSAMLRDAEAGLFTHVVAVDLDRLLRSNRDLLKLIDLKLKVVTVDGEIDLSTADGEFRANMLASIARFEGQRKGERQMRANEARAAKGKPIAGVRAFGWEKGNVTVLESEAEWVRYAHRELIAGASIHSICRALAAAGVTGSRGARISPQQLRMILKRPRNAGILRRHGIPQTVSLIEPIVSVADHELVLSILAGRSETSGPKPEINWMSGLILCSCGHGMAARNVTNKGKERIRVYMCGTVINHTNEPGSKHVTIVATAVETKVLAWLYGFFSAGAYKVTEPDSDALRAVQEALVSNDAARAQVMELGAVPGADLAWIGKKLKGLTDEREKLAAQRSSLVLRGASGTDIARLIDEQGDSAASATAWLEWWNTLPLDRRRSVIRDGLKVTIGGPGNGAKRVHIDPLF